VSSILFRIHSEVITVYIQLASVAALTALSLNLTVHFHEVPTSDDTNAFYNPIAVNKHNVRIRAQKYDRHRSE
ncbi:hypothetical protein L9F63_009286, partial [Diploptera punctata]